MEIPNWLPLLLIAPMATVLIVGIPTMIVCVIKDAITDGVCWFGIAYFVMCCVVVISGATGMAMIERDMEGRDKCHQSDQPTRAAEPTASDTESEEAPQSEATAADGSDTAKPT